MKALINSYIVMDPLDDTQKPDPMAGGDLENEGIEIFTHPQIPHDPTVSTETNAEWKPETEEIVPDKDLTPSEGAIDPDLQKELGEAV